VQLTGNLARAKAAQFMDSSAGLDFMKPSEQGSPWRTSSRVMEGVDVRAHLHTMPAPGSSKNISDYGVKKKGAKMLR